MSSSLVSPAACGRRHGVTRELGFLAVVAVVYLGLSLYQIDLPGMYGDELDRLLPTVSLLTGQPFLWAERSVNVFGYRLLLTFTDRIGPVQSYLPMPFILLLGYTPIAVRLPAVLCGLGTLIAAYFGAKLWCGPRVAQFGIALTAVAPMFVFTQRMANYNYGQVTLFVALVFLFLARYQARGKPLDLWLVGAGAGLAINTGLHDIMVLSGIVLVWFFLLRTERVPVRDFAIALAIFLLIGFPVIGVSLRTGAALARMGWTGQSHRALTLTGFIDTLSVHARHFTGMLVGLDGVQMRAVGRNVKNGWMIYAFVGSLLMLAIGWMASRHRREFAGRRMAPMLITLIGLCLTGLITGGRVSYQLIMLWPFPLLTIGAGLAEVVDRVRWVGIALAGALVVSELALTVQVHGLLTDARGHVFTSSQIYPLAEYLNAQPGRRVITMDWGLLNQIYYLTGGAVRPKALHGWWPKGSTPPEEFVRGVRKEMLSEHNVYVFLRPGKGLFDRFPPFEGIVREGGRMVELEREFRERDGTIVYRVYRVATPARGGPLRLQMDCHAAYIFDRIVLDLLPPHLRSELSCWSDRNNVRPVVLVIGAQLPSRGQCCWVAPCEEDWRPVFCECCSGLHPARGQFGRCDRLTAAGGCLRRQHSGDGSRPREEARPVI